MVTLASLALRYNVRYWTIKKDIVDGLLRTMVATSTVGYDGYPGTGGQAFAYSLYVVMNPSTGEVYDYYVIEIDDWAY